MWQYIYVFEFGFGCVVPHNAMCENAMMIFGAPSISVRNLPYSNDDRTPLLAVFRCRLLYFFPIK